MQLAIIVIVASVLVALAAAQKNPTCQRDTEFLDKDKKSCQPATVCQPGTAESSKLKKRGDRTCGSCANGTFSTTINSNKCKKFTVCRRGSVELVAGTPTSDRVCSPTSNTTRASTPTPAPPTTTTVAPNSTTVAPTTTTVAPTTTTVAPTTTTVAPTTTTVAPTTTTTTIACPTTVCEPCASYIASCKTEVSALNGCIGVAGDAYHGDLVEPAVEIYNPCFLQVSGSLSFSTGSGILSIEFPSLTFAGAFAVADQASVTRVVLSQLHTTTMQFQVSRNPLLTFLSTPKLASVQGLNICNNAPTFVVPSSVAGTWPATTPTITIEFSYCNFGAGECGATECRYFVWP